jgi:hypothetical protein
VLQILSPFSIFWQSSHNEPATENNNNQPTGTFEDAFDIEVDTSCHGQGLNPFHWSKYFQGQATRESQGWPPHLLLLCNDAT